MFLLGRAGTLVVALIWCGLNVAPLRAQQLEATVADRLWMLPSVPYPKDNEPSAAREQLGKALFFDPRLSADKNMSCASCHNPALGWSDGLPTARGHHGKLLPRATPSIYNSAYNSIQMWDGRKATLEEQALGPMESKDEMAAELALVFAWLRANEQYTAMFVRAYPNESIGAQTLAKAIASFERTVVSNDSPFDRWLQGDKAAMTAAQVHGFRVFTDPQRGNCAACHQAPNFTDNGFHNIGLQSFAAENADLGRYAQKPVKALRGAFKTPGLRNVARTAPYFHDGSAATLVEVVEHYVRGGDVVTNLSPNLKALVLTKQEKADLVAFLQALTGDTHPVSLPVLP